MGRVKIMFSLDSSMIAVTAVQEMLLHPAGEHLVFGGGAPPELDGEFWGLRSPFGDLVSGTIAGGRLMSAELHSARPGMRHLALDGEPADWLVRSGATQALHRGEPGVTVPVEAGAECSLRRDPSA